MVEYPLRPRVRTKIVYESEHTKFMRQLMQLHPEYEEDQRKGRELWWDRPVDLEEERRFRQSGVPQLGYVYQIKG